MSSAISFGGLASGLNTQSIISQLMSLERAPEQLLQKQQDKNTAKVSEFQKIEDALTSLQTVVQGFKSPLTFNSLKSSVIDSSVITATATSAATPGTHSVQVTSLAKSQRQVSFGVASNTSLVFSTGSFTISDGAGTTTTVNVAEGQNSLQGLASAINSSGANVSASIINDGAKYRLVVNGDDTKNYTLDFTGLGTSPAGGTGPLVPTFDPAAYQAGTAAQLVVDGITMTKASNMVTDAIQGVTLNLLKEGGASTTLSVTNDTDAVTTKINNFVAAYNKAITLVNSESAYDATTKTAGTLSGNSTVRDIQQRLRSLLTAVVPGGSGSITCLAALGVNSDSKKGTLSVDTTKLSDALANHYSDVVNYMTHNGDSVATLTADKYGLAQQFNMMIDGMVHPYIADGMSQNGSIEIAKRTLTNANSAIDKEISNMEDRVTQMQTNMENQYNAMEKMVSNLQSQGNLLLSALGYSSSSSSTSK